MGISQQFFGFYKYFPTFFDKFVIMVHSIAIKRCVDCIHKRLHGRPIFEKRHKKAGNDRRKVRSYRRFSCIHAMQTERSNLSNFP